MKNRSLSLLLLTLCAGSLSAQIGETIFTDLPFPDPAAVEAHRYAVAVPIETNRIRAQRIQSRAASPFAFYRRPAGSFIKGFTSELGQSYPTICGSAMVDKWAFTKVTKSSNFTWTYEFANDGELQYIPLEEYETEGENLDFPIMTFGIISGMPRMSSSIGNYKYGESWYKQTNSTATVTNPNLFLDFSSGVVPMTVAEINEAPRSWTYTDTQYFFGSIEGDNGRSPGFVTLYPAPQSPLYVQSVTLICYSRNNKTPMLAGTSLQCTIMEGTDSDVVGNATMKAADLKLLKDYGNAGAFFSATFIFPEEDELILKKEFQVFVSGFENEGVDLGVWATFDRSLSYYPASSFYYMPDASGKMVEYGYSGKYNDGEIRLMSDPLMMLNAEFSVLKANKLTSNIYFPAEGGNALTYLDENKEQKNDVWIYASSEEVSVDKRGTDSWISMYNLDETDFETDRLLRLYFQADPLPKGVEKRTGKITLEGAHSTLVLNVQQGGEFTSVTDVTEAQKEIREIHYYDFTGQQIKTPEAGQWVIVKKEFIDNSFEVSKKRF